jgi:hypothetical protein
MASTLQSLPPLARNYSRQQRQQIDAIVAEVVARWSAYGPSFDSAWMLSGPYIVQAVLDAQAEMAERATTYIPAVLAATGQAAVAQQSAEAAPESLVGLTGAGYQVAEALAATPIRAKQAVAAGATPTQALDAAGGWLAQSSLTILADTARSAESLGRYTRNVGYVRMVNGGACGRCVVQAGKWFRTNQGFLRHPRCRCVHIPASEDAGRDWQTNPDAYFHSLTPEQQIKLLGSKANAQAVVDGADIGQIVNAYRKTAGMQYAQAPSIKVNARGQKFTTEGTSRRGLAGQQQAGLRRNGLSQQRLMPETIAMRARGAEDRMRLLMLYGWIRDEAAVSRGRDALTEARRLERNARAVARRAERASAAG